MIKIIFGPMFASKTTTLLAEIKRLLIAEKKCLIIEASIDRRYDDLKKSKHRGSIITHDGDEFDKVDVSTVQKLSDVSIAINYDVIGITEGHFFPDIVEQSRIWAAAGIIVIIDTLSGDYKQELFANSARLIAEADIIIHRVAVCMKCKHEHAPFTVRLIESSEQTLVGTAKEYMAVCRQCRDTYFNHLNK